MDAATKIRLVQEGRTHWFAITIDTGRRFPTIVHRWARDADHARSIVINDIAVGRTIAGEITDVKEQHR